MRLFQSITYRIMIARANAVATSEHVSSKSPYLPRARVSVQQQVQYYVEAHPGTAMHRAWNLIDHDAMIHGSNVLIWTHHAHGREDATCERCWVACCSMILMLLTASGRNHACAASDAVHVDPAGDGAVTAP
jgi:hypothetical protein